MYTKQVNHGQSKLMNFAQKPRLFVGACFLKVGSLEGQSSKQEIRKKYHPGFGTRKRRCQQLVARQCFEKSKSNLTYITSKGRCCPHVQMLPFKLNPRGFFRCICYSHPIRFNRNLHVRSDMETTSPAFGRHVNRCKKKHRIHP